MLRTHTCGELRLSDANKHVTLAGWVQRVRDKGSVLWIDLRDRYGITQLIFEEGKSAADLVKMRYFVGMTVPEIATALDLAPRTVDRHWAFARAWLKRTIRSSLSGPAGPG